MRRGPIPLTRAPIPGVERRPGSQARTGRVSRRAPRVAAALGALLLAGAAHAAAPLASALDTLVSAERAFSALSSARGMKDAFLANLADDAVVFRPAPANGRQVWRARPNPRGTLAWAPDYAEISGAGDLGVTSGPWEYRQSQPAAGREPPVAYGHFVSVWRRSKDGAWRVAADIGIDHGKPPAGLDAVELFRGPEHPKPKPPPPDFGSAIYGGPLFSRGSFDFATGPGYVSIEDRRMARAINAMMTAERSLVFIARNHGILKAYSERAAADVRVYRTDALPMIGLSTAMDTLARRGRRVEIAPHRHGMSASRDLGYSYGLIVARASASARPDTVSYLHVWRRDGEGPWKLALDVEDEFARR